ncbi:MAG: response regulator transcription factor [Thermoleophilia bacterium]|nr:response regulator transcription factor [Thermoleophilia bacterium]
MRAQLTAVVIDEHEITRRALRSRCAAQGRVDVIGESDHAEHGSYVVERLVPTVVIADLVLDPAGTFQLPRLLLARHIHVPVIAFSGLVTRSHVRAAFMAGARGVVAKDAPPSVLMRAIEAVVGGTAFVDPEIAILMLDTTGVPSTPLQRDVLTATASGRDHRSVAIDLQMRECEISACADLILERISALGAPPEIQYALAVTLQVARPVMTQPLVKRPA